MNDQMILFLQTALVLFLLAIVALVIWLILMRIFRIASPYFAVGSPDFPPAVKIIFNTLGIILMFFGTYWIAPKINETFEQQKRQTAFFQSYFESFNTDNQSFYSKLTVYIASSDANVLEKKQYDEIRELISKMQMRIFELSLLIPDEDLSEVFVQYQNSLNDLITDVETAKSQQIKDKKALRKKLENFSLLTGRLIRILAKRANVLG